MGETNGMNNLQANLRPSESQDQGGMHTKVLLHAIDSELPTSLQENYSPSAKFDWRTINGLCHDSSKSRGGWKTMPYILGNELTGNLASFGLQWNLIIYLTQVYRMGHVQAMNVLNVSSGTSSLAALLGAFIADACLGPFLTIFSFSIVTLMGMVFLLMTATVASLRPAPCLANVSLMHVCQTANGGQKSFLFVGFLLLAIGSGSLKSCTYAFGADQFPQRTPEEKKDVQSYSNWFFFFLYVTLLLCSTIIVYVQTNIGWGWGFGIPVIAMSFSIVIFLAGTPRYRHRPPTGSAFTSLLQVLVAAFRKRALKLPSDENALFQDKLNETFVQDSYHKLVHTNKFRFLDKAAIKIVGDISEGEGGERNAWRLCTVQQVEELKCLLKLVPIWACGILLATNLAQQGSYPVLQALTMDRHILGSSFEMPAGSIGLFSIVTLVLWVPFYDQVILPIARKITGNVRGITLLQRIGTGCFLACIAALVSGFVESMRKHITKWSGLTDQPGTPVPMSVFWLIPQGFLNGLAESFFLIGQAEFFYDQMPGSMHTVAGAMVPCGFAVGNYLNSALISVVHKATDSSRGDWLGDNLNRGHLDYFYYLVFGLLAANLVLFMLSARWYTYKNVSRQGDDSDDEGEEC